MKKPQNIIDACVGMVTADAQPLSVFDSPSFQALTNQLFDGLKMTKISSRNVMEFIREKCSLVKSEISKKLAGKVFSLKMDTATRSDRSVLGVNVQIIKNNKILIYTLAMIEIKRRHTAENLKQEVEIVLGHFNISLHQIYSVTTDNGRIMVTAVGLLSTSNIGEG